MTTLSQEKSSSRITSTGPHRFKLFGKPGPFSILSKMGWITSKRRRATGKQQLLSMLTCCTFNDKHGQGTSRHQVRSQPAIQRPQSNNPTPSQTVTYSNTSLSLKGVSIYDNISTDRRPYDTNKDRMIDHGKPTSLTENIEHQQMDDSNILLSSQQTMDSTSELDHHHRSEMLVQKGIISHMDQNDDLQETTTPSLDNEQDLWLLAPISEQNKGRKCLVLDLDETLVHSSFKATSHADFAVPVEIDGSYHNVYVLKRPGVDTFMKRMGKLYEIVVFTASLSKYADPVLDTFDIHHVVQHRLFRESCFHHKGTYVKDLSQLGRELNQIIILDNSPASYIFHTTSAIPVSSWFNDPHDSELVDLIPFLEDLATVDDVTDVLDCTLPGPFSHF